MRDVISEQQYDLSPSINALIVASAAAIWDVLYSFTYL